MMGLSDQSTGKHKLSLIISILMTAIVQLDLVFTSAYSCILHVLSCFVIIIIVVSIIAVICAMIIIC